MVEISTSLLSVKKENCMQTIHNLEVAHTDYYHIDVMDGKFVENDTSIIMKEYVEYVKQITNIPIDVHLMVEDVESYVKSYLAIEPNVITFHIEALKDKNKVMELINYIKQNNCKVGISICPETNIEEIYDYLPYIHMVLVMSVQPGKGGQELIPSTLEKAKKLSQYLKENNLEVDIEIDGGVNSSNIEQIKSAGVDIAVVGTYLINQNDYKETIKNLKS